MSIKVQFFSVVLPAANLEKCNAADPLTKQLREAAASSPRSTNEGPIGSDGELICLRGRMGPWDIEADLKSLEAIGLELRKQVADQSQWKDVCVVDQKDGPTLPCEWIEFDRGSKTVWLKGGRGRPTRKVAGDIVVLLDISASMATVVDAIRTAWVSFVRQLLDPDATEGPQVDLRLKVVGYAMSQDGTQPVIQSNPFVHNDVAAFDAQFANLKTMSTNHSPRPLLDALWQTISVGSMPREQEVMTAAQWRDRKAARRIVTIFTDAPFMEQMLTQEAAGCRVADVVNLVMKHRVVLNVLSPEHECYCELAKADSADCEFGSIIELLQKSDWQKTIMVEVVARIHRDPPWIDPL